MASSINSCVLLLDLPEKALAGIDLLSFTASPTFKGVKNLPCGLHFIFAASDSALSVRHGAWFYVSPGTGSPQVFVKRWNPHTEDLVAETSQTEVLRWKGNLGSIWRDGLTPYRQTVQEGDSGAEGDFQDESQDWDELTSRITQTLLSRICGLNPDHWSLTSASSGLMDLESIPGLETSNSTQHPEKELNFLPIDLKRTWRVGATGRERTEAAQDRSWYLGDLMDNHSQAGDKRGRELEVLGELQFAFLMVLTLNNHSCLEQWKRILSLLFTCRQAIKERSQLFIQLLRTLHVQLSHCVDMDGFFDMNEVGGGFLRPLFSRFRKTLDDFDGKWKADMVDELDELEDYLQNQFGWERGDSFVKRGMLDLEDGERVEMDVNGASEDDESGDYAPTVVELTRAQLEELNGGGAGEKSAGSESAGDERAGEKSADEKSADDDQSTADSEDEADLDDMDERY